MKLVLFADLHLDAPFRGLGPELARRCRRAQRATLERIVGLAEAERADALLVAGDVYEHERWTPESQGALHAAFARLAPVPVLVAPGNHDHLHPAGCYRRTQWTPNVHVFAERHPTRYALADGLSVWGTAHHAPAGTPNPLAGFAVDGGGVHLGLLHGSERGGLAFEGEDKAPHAPFDAADVEAAGLHHACCGHHHRPRHDRLVTYPGNPEPLAFGEDGTRGAAVLEVAPDGAVTARTVPVATTTRVDVAVDLDGCATADAARARCADALAGVEGIVRLHVGGEVDPAVDVRPEDVADRDGLAPHLEALVPGRWRVTPAVDLDELARRPGVEGRFVREVLGSDLEPAEQRRVVHTGLRALAGRDDLAVP